MKNERIIKIVSVLLNQDNFITIDQISNQLNVSNKTIRNDLHLVEEWLKENKLELIKKTGVGICIEGPHSQKLHILDSIREKTETMMEHSPQARKIFIGMQLAIFDKCRIYELSEQLYVSRATIHKDILSLSEELENFKITLHRKNNNGISIEGKEKNIRNFLLEMMLQDKGYQQFIEIVQNDHYVCDGSYVFAGLETTDDEVKDFVDCIIHSGNTYISSLTFHSLILILLRIFATYLRVQDKHYIDLSDQFIKELQQEPFYNEALKITDRLSNHYRFPFPEEETRYFQVYFLAMQNSQNINDNDKIEAAQLTEELLQSWSDQLHLPFNTDNDSRDAIFAHLCPSITRFKHGIPNENPLISEIHDMYQHTIDVVKNSIGCIEKHFNCKVSEDEISYLALHLATSLERMKQPLRTILVSHGGNGAATLLRRKLITQIPEIDILSQETFLTIYRKDLTNIELIISTIDITIKEDIPILKINPILHNYDILRLKNIIKGYYNDKNDPDKIKATM